MVLVVSEFVFFYNFILADYWFEKILRILAICLLGNDDN